MSRDDRPGAAIRQFARDVRFGMRLMLKSWGFVAAALVIIALGVSAVTAIVTVVYGVMLRPLPYPAPERLVSVRSALPAQPATALVNVADYREWRNANHVFDEMALVRDLANFNLTSESGEPERVLAARVTASLFRVLGTRPLYGSTFTDDAERRGNEDVVVLSYGLWRRRFASDPSIVGRTIRLSGVAYTVVGVMPASFSYPTAAFQLWVPLTINPAELSRAVGGFGYTCIARLRPGISIEQARREMTALARRVAATHSAKDSAPDAVLVSLLDDVIRSVRPTLLLLLGAVCCLLLIACLNVATLFSARAARRASEFAIRLALGASRARIVSQAFAEVLPIVVIGGVLGVASASWAVRAFVAAAPPGLARIESIEINTQVLVAALAAVCLTAVAATLLPATEAWSADFRRATQDRSRSATSGIRHRRIRSVMVATQVAVAVPLLVGSGVLVRSFVRLSAVDPGIKPDHVLSLLLAVPRSKYPGDQPVAAFETRLLDAVRSLPGVNAAGMVNRLPFSGYEQSGAVEVENPAGEPAVVDVDVRPVTTGYFEALGIPLERGRSFTIHDDSAARRVVIVDERLARMAWPRANPIGKRLREPNDEWLEVVGVVGHVRHQGFAVDPRPQVYWSYLQKPQDRMALVVRGHGEATALVTPVLQAIRSVDPDQPAYDVRPMDEVLRRSTTQRRMTLALLLAFALSAVLLASVGIYALVAFAVSQRLREFGIRIALGASPSDVARLVVSDGATLACLGIAIGIGAALLLADVMRSLVFETNPRDVVSLASATLLVLAVATAASYLPARRAASVDPAVTLRAD